MQSNFKSAISINGSSGVKTPDPSSAATLQSHTKVFHASNLTPGGGYSLKLSEDNPKKTQNDDLTKSKSVTESSQSPGCFDGIFAALRDFFSIIRPSWWPF